MDVTGTLPEDLEAELKAELDAMDAARGAAGVSDDYLRFCEQVAYAHTRARAAIRSAVRRQPVPKNVEAGSRLTLDEVSLDEAVLMTLLEDIARASRGEDQVDQVRALATAARQEPGLLTRLTAAATLGDDARPLQEAARRLGFPPHALLFMARLLARPFLVEARLRRGEAAELDVRSSDTRNGRCPTCGSSAGLAVLRAEDGARRLCCLGCDEAWLAPRLMCASCGTRDQAELATLCVSEGDPRWLEVCDACRRYLKTIDEARLAGYTIVPMAEDACTLHLDMIAEKEGYVRSAL